MVKNSDLYKNKTMLAPMVRVGTLPMRLLAVKYGADLVYCEEIIDFKILKSKRIENAALGTVDFVLSDGTIIFRTFPEEKDKLIFQIGTADAKRALKAAQKIQDLVAGVDVNMGCPKEFSIKGGMGAALLTQPEKVKEILTTLVNGLSVPVTCKIRVFPNLEDTLKLVRLIESTGVSAVGVHGRTKEERPRHPNRNDVIKTISETLSIPVIANGGSKEIKVYEDIAVFKHASGCSSVMIARAAEWNPTIFRPEGKLPLLEIVKEYVKVAIDWDNNWVNTKYCVLQMMHDNMLDFPEGELTQAAMSMEEISEIWGLKEYFLKVRNNLTRKQSDEEQSEDGKVSVVTKDDGGYRICMPLRFEKKDFSIKISPKLKLFEWTKSKNINKPVYITTERAVDRNFNCVLHLNNNEFTTPYWEKSKQLAEQASAAVATTVLDIVDGRVEEPSEQLEKCRVQWLGLKIDKNLINIDNGNQENCDKGKNSDMSQSAKRKCDTHAGERNKKVCPDEDAG
ncbi:tRNA-dihydrouridine(20) synthase [NAD(P)+]-like [Saccostrea cucullata]|uniref:tRNA-dihydrouridine(20) synthase [NAD(P)+]-like n=1 Tax=Saccostrea cuccullata TaxID=36930 RepID=UPI002ED0E5D9